MAPCTWERPRGTRQVPGHVADLALMPNVRVLADEIRGATTHRRPFNNAGALFPSRKATSERFERTFALNRQAKHGPLPAAAEAHKPG